MPPYRTVRSSKSIYVRTPSAGAPSPSPRTSLTCRSTRSRRQRPPARRPRGSTTARTGSLLAAAVPAAEEAAEISAIQLPRTASNMFRPLAMMDLPDCLGLLRKQRLPALVRRFPVGIPVVVPAKGSSMPLLQALPDIFCLQALLLESPYSLSPLLHM